MTSRTESVFDVEIAHQYFAKKLNGEVWDLLEKESRTPAEDALMMHAAHASLYHWMQVGTVVNHQRGEWLIARVYSVLAMPTEALWHAQKCLTLTETHPTQMADFDIAFAYEGIARAYAVANNHIKAKHFNELALQAGNAIADEEDRRIFFSE